MSAPQCCPDDDASSAPTAGVFPVVAIGASAGGLEAFTQLLGHLPVDTGMAFVLVQHLDPSQPSLLSEIMGRTTAMPVHEVVDGVAIAPNQVYVIPPNTAMTIVAGELRLKPRPRSRTVSRIIDGFFTALAQERGPKAIGVVLSGADADGTLGLQAIKGAGGITFSQSEASAKFSSMPHMAIATGQVDFIQPPEEIAQTLAHLSAHPYVASPAEPAAPQTIDRALADIVAVLKRHTKIDFAQYKPSTLNRRVLRRMALHHLESLESYSQYLQANPEEIKALHQEILIGVTSFFRDAEVYTALGQTVFPALMHHRQRLSQGGQPHADLPLRIWVAGCSTGEEAYSIAICLLEYLGQQAASPSIQIFATDVNERAIEIARFGWYSPSQVSEVSPERLQRFFVESEGGYQINKVVRELCIFACQNLASDPPFSRLDLISCRNVLIYFGAALQNKVLPMFHYGLKPEGFLLLGSSETVGEFSHLFSLVDSRHKLYAKQLSSSPLNFDFDPTSYTPSPVAARPTPAAGPSPELDLYGLADQVVLNRYGPAGVLVNDRLEILQFRGQTGAYLEPSPGRASLNLLAMAREELRLDLRTAFYQAKQGSSDVVRSSLCLDAGGRPRPVQIAVVPLAPRPEDKPHYLVLFSPLAPDPMAAGEGAAAVPGADEGEISQYQQANLALQHDLDTTRSHLQSIIQEQEATNQDLRAANEEILSSNEELQSTNEELQTAKEEIQATNEELSTINDELYRRNAETTRIGDDFQNLLSSVHIPILMLEENLRIRRFTPTAAALFNLITSDVGRPLSDINHRLGIDDLEAKILAVMTTLTQTSQTVQDEDGHWYDLRIRPYRTLDNRIDGAVVVLVDIDSLQRSTEQLRLARDYADAIVQTVREALVVLTGDLRVVTANRQFYQVFQVSPEATEGRSIFELGNGQWDIPQLRSLLHELLPQNLQVDDFEVVHQFETIGPKTMRLNARKMVQPQGNDLILLAIEDIPMPPG
ncbi:MAG TPA: chemotaxis protein CheB [Nodosilinea sp.]|nr:chemotaxis protein CheB [Nodosilinea sp.]